MPAADLSNQFDQLMKEAKSLAPADTREQIVSAIFQTSAALSQECVTHTAVAKCDRTEQIDRIVTSKRWGFPIMLALLAAVLYMTIAGANVFSDSLARLFGTIETYLTMAFQAIHAPDWLHGLIVLGLYRGTAWVVSVMLPPMAIFFPVFALLENYGYLPRVAFNMDRLFKKAGAHGKQSLTMAMGFGCNAAAIMSTRIIESPRERMLAILTNNFVPCNGRWPTLILLSSLFMAAGYTGGWNTFSDSGCGRRHGVVWHRRHVDRFMGLIQDGLARHSDPLHAGAAVVPTPENHGDDHPGHPRQITLCAETGGNGCGAGRHSDMGARQRSRGRYDRAGVFSRLA